MEGKAVTVLGVQDSTVLLAKVPGCRLEEAQAQVHWQKVKQSVWECGEQVAASVMMMIDSLWGLQSLGLRKFYAKTTDQNMTISLTPLKQK